MLNFKMYSFSACACVKFKDYTQFYLITTDVNEIFISVFNRKLVLNKFVKRSFIKIISMIVRKNVLNYIFINIKETQKI